MKWNTGRLTQCSVTSDAGAECRIYCSVARLVKVECSRGKDIPILFIGNKLLSFLTVKGETYRLFVIE